MTKILVVDDERPIADILKYNLQKEGFQVLLAYDGDEALQLAYKEKPSLIILDIMLPKKDGFTVCRELRTRVNIPIIMLTAKEGEIDKVLGLELGADDYVTKPFSIRELIARVKAALRREQMHDLSRDRDNKGIIKCGEVIVDLDRMEVTKKSKKIELTYREYSLLVYLLRYHGYVLSREKLLNEVWGYDYYGDERTVDVTIRRLREKIENDPSQPDYIQTKRGVGYYLRGPVDV